MAAFLVLLLLLMVVVVVVAPGRGRGRVVIARLVPCRVILDMLIVLDVRLRSGGTCNIETDGSGNNGGTQPDSFDSGETQESRRGTLDMLRVLTCSMEMMVLLKAAMKDTILTMTLDGGYEEEYGGFGDY